MNTAIVTDSTADLPAEIVEAYDIRVINNYVVIDGKEYTDNIDITREEFYEMLPGMAKVPTTGTASSGAYLTVYRQLFSEGFDHIISLHPSAKLSGILNAASTAARSFPGKVHLVDTGQVSMGLGFQVLEAVEAVRKGLGIDQVLACVESVKRRVKLIAMLDTMEYVRRSGRVSWAKATVGALLSIKPFIELREGKVINLGRVRTRAKGIEHLMQLFQKCGAFEKLAIVHTNIEDEARQFAQRLNLPEAIKPIFINVTTVIGTHVGPGALGFIGVTVEEAGA